MRNLHSDMLDITAKRRAMRANARRRARVVQFATDGVALIATLAFIASLFALAYGFSDGRSYSQAVPTYALTVTDAQGDMSVIDYALTLEDCMSEARRIAMPAQCDFQGMR